METDGPMMVHFRLCTSFALLGVVCGSTAQSRTAPEDAPRGIQRGQIRLEAKDGRTHFEIGDPIVLELVVSDPEFKPEMAPKTPLDRAMHKGSQLTMNVTEYGDLADKVSISPGTGWFQWQGPSGHDFLSSAGVTEKEIRVPLTLNHGYVFQEPGHYEVRVTTNRLSGSERTTNAVGIDLIARSPEAEATLVRSLDAEVAADSKNCGDALERLGYLPGDDAVQSKVRWMLRADDDRSYDMRNGLAASRNYDLQLQLLEAAWQGPQTVPNSQLLEAMDATRLYRDGKMQAGWQMVVYYDPNARLDEATQRRAEARQADIQSAVDSLRRRTGQNRADTAYFLIEYAGANPAQLAAVRPVAVEEFARMDPMEQGMLLEAAWPRVRDPRLAPALAGMLDKPPAQFVGHGDALKRLIELDPERAKPYAVREICNPKSDVRLEHLHSLPDKNLPEVDGCLAAQLRAFPADRVAQISAGWKLDLATRFATVVVLPSVRAALPDPLASPSRFALELRLAPADAVDALRGHPDRMEQLMYGLNSVYKDCSSAFPPEFLAFVRELLRSHDLGVEERAAYELEQGGEAGDRDLLLRRLAELRKANSDGTSVIQKASAERFQRIETQFMESIRQGRAWYTPNAEASQLAQGCLSEACRNWGKPRIPDARFVETN